MICYYGISLSSYKTDSAEVRSAWHGTGDKLVIQCLKNPSKTRCFFLCPLLTMLTKKEQSSSVKSQRGICEAFGSNHPGPCGTWYNCRHIFFFSNSIPFSHSTCDCRCFPVERLSSPRSCTSAVHLDITDQGVIVTGMPARLRNTS